MCDFASGLIDIKDTDAFYCVDLQSHSGTYNALKLAPGSYREFEWLRDDDGKSLSVRVAPGDKHDANWYKACVLAKFPTRPDFIRWAIPRLQAINISLLMPYIEVDENGRIFVAKDVDYKRNCTGLTKLECPKATTVYASGCTGLTKLECPKGTYVDAYGCTGLTKLECPKATTVDASGCTGLTKLECPKATAVNAYGCTGLTIKRT